MLSDCRQKKIDLVLVKSVSRFAREVVDGLETIRELKSIGIPVYFDMEEMNSFQPDFELYYSIYATVAQSEQESARDNVAVAIRQKVKTERQACIHALATAIKKTKMAIS